MIFANSDVLKIAQLARMSLTDAEVSQFQKDLTRILGYIDQLKEVDITGSQPMSHAGDFSMELREDLAQPGLGRACLTGSAGYEDGLVRVPKIIE